MALKLLINIHIDKKEYGCDASSSVSDTEDPHAPHLYTVHERKKARLGHESQRAVEKDV